MITNFSFDRGWGGEKEREMLVAVDMLPPLLRLLQYYDAGPTGDGGSYPRINACMQRRASFCSPPHLWVAVLREVVTLEQGRVIPRKSEIVQI